MRLKLIVLLATALSKHDGRTSNVSLSFEAVMLTIHGQRLTIHEAENDQTRN
jgi:hypothetical protein